VEIRGGDIILLPEEGWLGIFADQWIFNALNKFPLLCRRIRDQLERFIDKFLEIGAENFLEIFISHDEILVDNREEFLDFRLGIKFLEIILSSGEHFLEIRLHELNILANHL